MNIRVIGQGKISEQDLVALLYSYWLKYIILCMTDYCAWPIFMSMTGEHIKRKVKQLKTQRTKNNRMKIIKILCKTN